jgi:uncharacterized phiE125 gp8 family phage protein
MRPILTGAPAIEPVSLADAKSWLREDASEEDDLIQALIVSARMTLEAHTRRFFVTQSWRLIFDEWRLSTRIGAGATLAIPFAPFQSVAAIRVFDANDVAQLLAPTTYRAPAAPESGRIVFNTAPPAPGRGADGIEIDFAVGYGARAEDTPEPLRRAMLMLVAHWRQNRGDADSTGALPLAVAAFAAPFRRERLL